MSALPDDTVHLLEANDSLVRQRTHLALCGALLPASGLVSASCPWECERDRPYCLECLGVAVRAHAKRGGRTPGVVIHSDGWSVYVS